MENRYTKEEMKLVKEFKKILDYDSLAVTAPAVRIPTTGKHSGVYKRLLPYESLFNSIKKKTAFTTNMPTTTKRLIPLLN